MEHGEIFHWQMQLWGEIVPGESASKVHLNKIELAMKKAVGGSWPLLEQG
jgi:hypothetical protein